MFFGVIFRYIDLPSMLSDWAAALRSNRWMYPSLAPQRISSPSSLNNNSFCNFSYPHYMIVRTHRLRSYCWCSPEPEREDAESGWPWAERQPDVHFVVLTGVVRLEEPSGPVDEPDLVKVVAPRPVHQVALVRRQGRVQHWPTHVLTLDGTDLAPPAVGRVKQSDILICIENIKV